jgi:kynureninase
LIACAKAWINSKMHASKFTPIAQGIYLLSHSVGRPPVDAVARINEDFFALWQEQAEGVWPQWLEKVDGFRKAIAGLLNANREDFCPQVNLSSALTKLLPVLPRQPGRDVIVYNEQDFPSMGFVLYQAQAQGFELRCIPAGRDPLDMQTWAEYLDADCCCVLVTHVHSNTGARVPVAKICQLARKQGIISIVDIAQSVGVVPIDLTAWNADFALGSCVKWLCGGPGAGFLWANPEIISHCHPVDVGWFSHENPFEFDIHNFRYAESVLRFWGGTPSVIPYVVATNSIGLIASIGVDTICAHNQALNQRVLNTIPAGAALTPSTADQRGGTLVLNFGERQTDVVKSLSAAGVHFDARPTGLRMSSHIYNSDSEIDTVIACLGYAWLNILNCFTTGNDGAHISTTKHHLSIRI